MNPESEICSRCRKPKQSTGSGSITQWLSVCRCEFASDEGASIDFCQDCGKRIEAGRQGSITQMIFRVDICSCKHPRISEKMEGPVFKGAAFEGYLDDGEGEEELELAPESFPVDRFKPISELGRGAGGSVYLCRDRLLGKKVAIKVLHVLTGEQLIAFQEEARVTNKLDHPRIVSILDFGSTESGVPFMVLEYFPGETLREHLDNNGHMEEETARLVFLQVIDGLAYAHKRGIFHRDLKPSNVMIRDIDSDDLQVKIIDFGVAKVSELTGHVTEYQGRTLAGTPFYMSPDVINGFDYSAASEIYSVGCMLFEALTGQLPFEGETALETLGMHANANVSVISDVVELNFSQSIELFVSNCLEKDPADRFQDMELAIQALSKFPDVESTPSEPLLAQKTFFFRTPLLFLLVTGSIISLMSSFWLGHNITTDQASGSKTTTPKNHVLKKPKTPEHLSEPLFLFDKQTDGFSIRADYYTTTDKNLKLLLNNPILEKTKNFSTLDLSRSSITGVGLKSLSELSFSGIYANGCPITDEGLSIISKVNGLLFLSIVYCNNLTENALSRLSASPLLRVLDIGGAQLSEKSLDALSGIKELRQIRIVQLPIAEAGVEALLKCPKLDTISLSSSEVSAAALAKLKKAQNLESLSFGYAVIDKETIEVVSSFRIEELTFLHCDLEGANLTNLAKSKSLKRVRIFECKNYSDLEIKKLAKSIEVEAINPSSKSFNSLTFEDYIFE